MLEVDIVMLVLEITLPRDIWVDLVVSDSGPDDFQALWTLDDNDLNSLC
jgi:hypothetical protein